MVKQNALMKSLSSNLHGFLNQIQRDLSVPDKKFLRDGFIGLVRSGHPIVCQMAREVPNQRSKYTTRVKQLDLHLTAESDFNEQVKQSLPTIRVPLVADDTPLILDLSDLAKPLATIVARSPGNDVPFMLLANLPVETVADAKRILRFYCRRWECEEGMQFLKEEVSIEAIRTFRWTAICRLVLLAAVVMLYLAWLWEKHLGLAERLIDCYEASRQWL